jgi:hypothetical protein
MAGDERDGGSLGFDVTVAHPARVYNYLLGGKDNFEADREAARQMIAGGAKVLAGVRANRAFLGRAVRFLAGEAGIRQFLDIGTGLPTADNTHEVAQAMAPESRIVYVDNDPALAPGSYLTISDVARDLEADANVVESADRLNKRLGPAQQTIRSPEQIGAFFSGLEMVEPGLVQLPQWRPDLGYTGPAGGITLSAYCGVGRKLRGGS